MLARIRYVATRTVAVAATVLSVVSGLIAATAAAFAALVFMCLPTTVASGPDGIFPLVAAIIVAGVIAACMAFVAACFAVLAAKCHAAAGAAQAVIDGAKSNQLPA